MLAILISIGRTGRRRSGAPNVAAARCRGNSAALQLSWPIAEEMAAGLLAPLRSHLRREQWGRVEGDRRGESARGNGDQRRPSDIPAGSGPWERVAGGASPSSAFYSSDSHWRRLQGRRRWGQGQRDGGGKTDSVQKRTARRNGQQREDGRGGKAAAVQLEGAPDPAARLLRGRLPSGRFGRGRPVTSRLFSCPFCLKRSARLCGGADGWWTAGNRAYIACSCSIGTV
ncbi:hypothetical protein BDY21DRAFT_143913 [Lineolata rhizophorae]|uniref:Uncharacterized protein n=1 Tax=Lineolata rhizophorae TaxID=578093 RepID=A0A6A6NNQ4_9PEZI|nr:hypothetical protein BDY21DRAFT_143913 [Lineolata rhizophorae]